MLNLNDVRTFVQVVQWSGFAPAARALDVPKSTLSKRVAELERALSVVLIQRTSRRFVVTPLGREFHASAQAMVALADDAEQRVRVQLSEPTGPVSITCSVPTAQGWLAPLVPSIARRFPRVELTVHATDRFVDLVHEGYDLALRDHVAPLPDSSLVQRRLAVDPIWLVAAPRYLRRRAVRAPEQLASHDALLTSGAGAGWTLSRGDEQRVVHPRARLVADETSVLLASAEAGLGIAALPSRLCAEKVESGALRRVLPDWTAGSITTTLLLTERRALLPSVRAVADALVRGARAGSDRGPSR